MSFYIHHEELDSHNEDLSGQIRRIRELRDKLYGLSLTAEPDVSAVLHRYRNKLRDMEDSLREAHSALSELSDNTKIYSRRLNQELQDLTKEAQDVFN